MQQIDQLLIQIVGLGQPKDVAVIAEDPHFDFVDPRVDGLPPEPEIAIQPAFARDRRRELHFSLEDDARLDRKRRDGSELLQGFV